jgi:hypothetical protein
MAAVPQSGLTGDTEAVLRGLGRPYEDGLALEAAIGSTTQISADALGRFVAGTYDPTTGTEPG